MVNKFSQNHKYFRPSIILKTRIKVLNFLKFILKLQSERRKTKITNDDIKIKKLIICPQCEKENINSKKFTYFRSQVNQLTKLTDLN